MFHVKHYSIVIFKYNCYILRLYVIIRACLTDNTLSVKWKLSFHICSKVLVLVNFEHVMPWLRQLKRHRYLNFKYLYLVR